MSLSQLVCESGKATVMSNVVEKYLFYGSSSGKICRVRK